MPEEKTTTEFVDWEGNQTTKPAFERILVPEENYNFIVKGVDLAEVKKFQSQDKTIKIKFVLQIDDQDFPDFNGKELVMFVPPTITKGSTNQRTGQVFSNSKLYDMLVDTGLKDKAKEKIGKVSKQDFPAKITGFLSEEFLGKRVRGRVTTSKKNTPEAYSLVSKILRIL